MEIYQLLDAVDLFMKEEVTCIPQKGNLASQAWWGEYRYRIDSSFNYIYITHWITYRIRPPQGDCLEQSAGDSTFIAVIASFPQ